MSVLTFTLESDAAQGDDWRGEIAELVNLFVAHPDLVDVARTTGAGREASVGSDPVAAARRQALMDTVPVITEIAVLGVSRYDEAVYAGPSDQGRFEQIMAALWPKKTAPPDLSEVNDAMHLDTHLRHGRDYFVTTDTTIQNAIPQLHQLGITVVDPVRATEIARSHVRTALDEQA